MFLYIYITFNSFNSPTARYTRRHHRFSEAVERLARRINTLTVHHENYPFATSRSLTRDERGLRVDTTIEGLSLDEIRRVDPLAVTAQMSHEAQSHHPPTMLLDYTFHHPGAHMHQVRVEELPHAGRVMADRAAHIKVAKYRPSAAKMSEEYPMFAPLAFVPAPLSVYGRQHPITHRLLRLIASRWASQGIAQPDENTGRVSLVEVLDDRKLLALYSTRVHSAMCAFSSRVASSMAEGLFESAREAMHPPQHSSSAPTTGVATTTHADTGEALPPTIDSQEEGAHIVPPVQPVDLQATASALHGVTPPPPIHFVVPPTVLVNVRPPGTLQQRLD